MFIGYANYREYANGYLEEWLFELKAKTSKDAIKELKDKIIGAWDEREGEFVDGIEANQIILYEVAARINIDADQWYSEKRKREKDYKKKMKEEERKQLYLELKKEFEA